jgi:O-antigen/teichoic acid export membrane protein
MIYGLGQVLNKTISLLLLPFFTAYLSTTDYGITSVIGIYTLILTSVVTFGSGSVIGLIYFRSDDRYHRSLTINSAMLFLILASTGGLLITLAGIGPLNTALFGNASYPLLLILSTLTALLNIIVMPITLWMQFEQKAIPFVIMNTTVVIVGMLLNIVAVIVLRMGVKGYVISSLLAAAFNLALFGVYYLRQTAHLRAERSLLRELFRLGWPLTFSFFFLFVIQNNSKYFLQVFSGLDAVGIFTIGYNLGTVISLPVNAFNTAYYPFIMSFATDPEKAPEKISAVAEKYVLAFCMLLTGVFIAAKPIVNLMVAPAFYPSHWLIGPVALGWFFSGLFIVIQPGLYYISKVHYISTVQLPAALLGALCSALLIPFAGLEAAAWSFAVGNACMFLIMHALNKELRIDRFYNKQSGRNWINLLISVGFAGGWRFWNPEKDLLLLSSFVFLAYLAVMVYLNKAEFRSALAIVQQKLKPGHAS